MINSKQRNPTRQYLPSHMAYSAGGTELDLNLTYIMTAIESLKYMHIISNMDAP